MIPSYALSCWQPWATGLVYRVDGEAWKRAEFRSWELPARLVGQPLALHATKRKPDERPGEPDFEGLPRDLPLGAIVGIVTFGTPIAFDTSGEWGSLITRDVEDSELAFDLYGWILDEPGCPTNSRMRWEDEQQRWWYAWPVKRAVALTPIPCVGHQGIWPVALSVRRAIRLQHYQRFDLPQGEPLRVRAQPVLPFPGAQGFQPAGLDRGGSEVAAVHAERLRSTPAGETPRAPRNDPSLSVSSVSSVVSQSPEVHP